ncbi:MAG: cell division protein FtsH, partial [Lachnospiraceae bacterium]|nr:cell division protein FtsH [Lachnospiraceae bacterium]
MKKQQISFSFIITIFLLVLAFIWVLSLTLAKDTGYTFRKYVEDLQAGKVSEVTISQNQEAPTGQVSVLLKDSSVKKFNVINTETAWQAAYDNGIDAHVKDVSTPSVFLTTVLRYVFILLMIFFIMSAMNDQAGGGGNSKMMNFGRSRAKMVLNSDGKGITFKDVAGVDEEKEELQEIVDFLKNPKKYIEIGARIPKGV